MGLYVSHVEDQDSGARGHEVGIHGKKYGASPGRCGSVVKASFHRSFLSQGHVSGL